MAMTLHPLYAERLASVVDITWDDLTATDGRRRRPAWDRYNEALFRPPSGYHSPDAAVRDSTVPGPHGDVPVRIYSPREGAGPWPGARVDVRRRLQRG